MPPGSCILGRQDDKLLNGAIIRMPATHRAVTKMIECSSERYFIPWWFKERRKREMKFRRMIGLGVRVSDLDWGAIGPNLLTAVINECDATAEIQPIDVFYPVHYKQVELLDDPELGLSDLCTQRTVALHLWRSLLPKTYKPGSVLDQIASGREPRLNLSSKVFPG